MCDTKKKIADVLKELMNEKPVRKITVQDIMDRKEMRRQSFYYHFRDIYDVINWICKKQLLEKMEYAPEETFEEWMCKVTRLIKEDRRFYRRVLDNIEREQLISGLYGVVEQQLRERRLLGKTENGMIMRFATRSICHFILDSISQMKEADERQVAQAARYIEMFLIPEHTRYYVFPEKTALGNLNRAAGLSKDKEEHFR
ncbi:hypothetical protein [Clostridium sp. Marseille-P2415]|uniref:hypothetical protein n=1 Tax=Clostridium sp. Marseille-P2415 TaxID=1805471 RepID=UPI0009883E59|nr:hypothetical protein [Clostridium sp. Marseille-P2415]